jgi:hypothetical protein
LSLRLDGERRLGHLVARHALEVEVLQQEDPVGRDEDLVAAASVTTASANPWFASRAWWTLNAR